MWQTGKMPSVSFMSLLSESIKGVTTSLRGKKHREITNCPEIFLVHVQKKTTYRLQQLIGNNVIPLLEKYVNLKYLDIFPFCMARVSCA